MERWNSYQAVFHLRRMERYLKKEKKRKIHRKVGRCQSVNKKNVQGPHMSLLKRKETGAKTRRSVSLLEFTA